MAFDAYIQIAEINGEALDEQYTDWIEIIGYKFGANQSTSATASSAGGASSGRTTLTNFTFTKIYGQLQLQAARSQLRWPASEGSEAGGMPRGYRKTQVLRSRS